VTRGGETPPTGSSGASRRRPVLSWRSRLEAFQRVVLRTPVARAVLEVTRAYDRAGGGMLAGALAYFAFFTMVPTLLLFAGLLGVLIEDAAMRARLIDAVVNQLDPIKDVATEVIHKLADSGRTGTVIGVLGLLWGASGFYGALEGAMQRMFPGPGSRDFLHLRLRGVVTVVVVLGVLLLTVLAVFVLPIVTDWLAARCATLTASDVPLLEDACSIDFVQVGSAIGIVAAIGIAFLAALMVYVVVPPNGPRVRHAFWPAVIVGIIIGLLTSLFGWVAPLLVRYWLTLGIVGSVFISLVWLNLVFQALLYGAAFARLRRDRDRRQRSVRPD
jgi:membrane protein